MKILTIRKSISKVVSAALFTFLFSACEKDTEMFSSQISTDAISMKPIKGGALQLAQPGTTEQPEFVPASLGYEEMRKVVAIGSFSINPVYSQQLSPVLEFEISQITDHPSIYSKPLMEIPQIKVRNLLNHSLTCSYSLKYESGAFSWEVSRGLILMPEETIVLGMLPDFYDLITGGIFSVSIGSLEIYDAVGQLSSSKQ